MTLWLIYCCFFFSSRRRHTRCGRDWSSDVCSSDLGLGQAVSPGDVLIAAGAGLLVYAGMGGSGRIPADAAPVWDALEPCQGSPVLISRRSEPEAPADHS